MYTFQVAPGESQDKDNCCFISFGIDNLDFLMIGTRSAGNMDVSVLIVIDHSTRYAAVYDTPKKKQHQ